MKSLQQSINEAKNERITIDITTDKEMKKAKSVGFKYQKQVDFSVLGDEIVFDGPKNILDKIQKELVFTSGPPKRK